MQVQRSFVSFLQKLKIRTVGTVVLNILKSITVFSDLVQKSKIFYDYIYDDPQKKKRSLNPYSVTKAKVLM